jgi:hypothetical protein
MSYIANEGIAPTIQLNSVGIGFQLDSGGAAINVDSLDLNNDEYLVVGEKTYIPEETHQRNTKWNLVVNNEGVAVNTSRNIASNFLSHDTSFYVDKNIHCTGIIKAAGLELSNISLNGDPLTSSLIRDFIVSANNISVNQPFQTGITTGIQNIYDNIYNVKNIFTPNYVTFGGYSDTYNNTHPLNIVATANNKFNNMHIAIRNDVNNIDYEPAKLCIGIIGGSNISPAIISTTKGMPLEFHVSQTSEVIEGLYSNSVLPTYTNSNYLPAMTIDENNNVGIGTNKTRAYNFNRKNYDGKNVENIEIYQEKTRLEVEGISSFKDILMFDYYTKTYKNLDDIYIRASGIGVLNATQIGGGSFIDINYKFNSNLEVSDLIKTKNIDITNNANVSNVLTSEYLIVNDSSFFKGAVNFDNEVNFINIQQVKINNLKINNDIFIGDKRITPIDIDDPYTGYGTYSRSEDGSNYLFVYVHSNIATLDANCNVSFPKKMGLGLKQSDGFEGILNIVKDDESTSNNFDIVLKNTYENNDYIANIGRLSRLDYNDNSLIVNTNKINGKNNNIYFYPSSDISELTSNNNLPNMRNTPPTLSLKKAGVGINKIEARNGYALDVEGGIVANEYYISVDNVPQRAKNFVYQSKNYFNIYDPTSDKYCVNYNNLTAFASDMRGFNVKRGINADLYYQNNSLIETLQIANDTNSFYTNKKIAIGWNGETVSMPLQIRNIATSDYNYSTIRIYRGARGGGSKNNADYSGIDICEYDRTIDQDRDKNRWFIYKNHKFNDVDARNVSRIGPLQIGYIDTTDEPSSYGMSFYYNRTNSNYHIDVNKPVVSYDSKSAMSIYGDLDVHGNINIIDDFGCNFNFKLSEMSSQMREVKTYINLIQGSQDGGVYADANNEVIMSFDIARPNKNLIIDTVSSTSIPLIVKQDNSNLSVAKFITYADNKDNCSSRFELGIYNSNLFRVDDNDELENNNMKNMVEFNVSSINNDTTLGLSYYNNLAYKNFINFKNNVGENGDIISTNTHIGIGDNIYNNSNITLHIDDYEKYGLQITNNQHPPAINLLSTKGSCNIYHTISGGDFENRYTFNIDIANSSTNNIPDSTSVFTIDAFKLNGDIRQGARFGFNEENPNESFVIKTDYDTSAMSITSRYSKEYLFESTVNISTSAIELNYLTSGWNNTTKTYKSEYSYDILTLPEFDNNASIISEQNRTDPDFLFRTFVPLKNTLEYTTTHSNLTYPYFASNLSVDYRFTNIYDSSFYDVNMPSYSNMANYVFNIDPPDISDTCNLITYDDLTTTNHLIQYNFNSNLTFIENINCNYNFVYKYEYTYNLPKYINCNISFNINYSSNIINNNSNFINIKNEIYTDFLPFDTTKPYVQHVFDDIFRGMNIDSSKHYSNIFILTDTSNIIRYNSNLQYNAKFTAEHTKEITFISSNYMLDLFKNIDDEFNSNVLSYNITFENGQSNINFMSSNLVLYNNVNNNPRNMVIENTRTDIVFDDVFSILGNTITNKIVIDEFYNNYSNYQTEPYILNIKNYNAKKYKPHITLINSIESLDRDSGHEIYSYDGIFEIKYIDSALDKSSVPFKIDQIGNTTIQGSIDVKGDLLFNGGHIYDVYGNDLVQILNKNYYKEYQINSSNINFNSLGSNGLEINAYSSSNYDDFKFLYARDYMSNNIVNDVMILHKNNSSNTKYKLDLYGDIDTSNGILRLEGRDIIRDTCNYILDTSNVISTRITDLVTDNITEELISSNKFIVNHKYDNNLTVNGNLYINSNLFVGGDTTRLDTTIFRSEVLEIVNEMGLDIALNIVQKPTGVDIINASNNTKRVFTLAHDGCMGLGIDNPEGVLLNIKQTSNNLDIINASNNDKRVFTLAHDGSLGLGIDTPNGILFNIKQTSNNLDIINASNNAKRVFTLAHDGSMGLGIDTPDGILFNIKQTSNNLDIINASNNTKRVFTLANDGCIGLGIDTPDGILFNIKQTSNNLDIINASNNDKRVFTLAHDGSMGLGIDNTGGILFNIKQTSNNLDIINASNNTKRVFTLANDGSLGLGVDTPDGILFNIKQTSNNLDIINASNNTKRVFTLANDGSLGLGVDTPDGILFNIKQTSNNLDIINASNNAKRVFTLANDGSLGLGVDTPDGILFNIKQTSNNLDIINASNNTKRVFTLAHDGCMGLGIDNPEGVLLNIKQTSNNLDIINASNNDKRVFTLANDGSLGLGVDTPGGILFNIKQTSNNLDIINASNNTKRVFTLANDGSMGLGVDTPNGILFNIKQTSNNLDIINASNNAKRVFTLAHDGSMGLGVDTPDGILFNIKQTSNNLDIINASNNTKRVFTLAHDGSMGLGIDNTGGILLNIKQTSNNLDIINASNNTKRVFTLANDGSLGLGVDTPDGILFNIKQTSNNLDIINASNNTKRVFTLANDGSMGLGVDTPNGILFNIKQTSNNVDIINASNNAKRVFTLANDGSLGLGVDNPDGVLFNIKQTNNNDILRASNNSGAALITITNSGILGLGVQTPNGNSKLDVNGNINIVNVGTDNFKYTIDGRDIVGDTNNYILNTSNVISTRITDLKTDQIYEELSSANKFIVNHKYDNNLSINGDLYVYSNLIVSGETTRLDTTVFTTEMLEVINEAGNDVALTVTQKAIGIDIFKAYNGSNEVFTITSNGSVGINTNLPKCSLHINTTDSIKLPRGNTSERPQNLVEYDTGLIRYNTESKQFEGFGAGNAWGSLGGVIDIAQKTFVRAEKEAGLGNNELEFYTNSNERMIIKSDGKVGIARSDPGYMLDVKGDIRTTSNLYVDNKIGIGTENPSALLSLYGDRADLKIQDSRLTGDRITSLDLINGPNSYFNNNSSYGWRMANSNNQFIISSGINGTVADNLIIDGVTGNIGVGMSPHVYDNADADVFKVRILGSLNVEGDIYKDGVLFSGGGGTSGGGAVGVIAQNMPVQTFSETYKKTRVMSQNVSSINNTNGWNFIDEDLVTGFVIKIKPSQRRSKILLNFNAHIGFDSSKDSRWWGLKLYRKIVGDTTRTSEWQEVSEANGVNDLDTNGTSCWLSHNLGANSTSYENSIANVSGTFFDTPDTRFLVYYTVKWKSRLGDNNVNGNLYTSSGDLYLNRPANYNTSNSPVLSSSWVATEIWQLGTPFIPSEGVNIITIYNQDYVGIGNTEPVYPLDINGETRLTSNLYIDSKIGIGTKNPSALLSLNGNKADLKIQDSRLTGDMTTSIELISGINSNFYNNAKCGWRMANSNNQFIISSGINGTVADNLLIDGVTGNIGVGMSPHVYDNADADVFKVRILGSLNVEGDIYKDGVLFSGGGGGGAVGVIAQNMPVQTFSETYKKTRVMSQNVSSINNTNGWNFIDEDLVTGFVIKIKPSQRRSKILLNFNAHIGFDSSKDSRWWGLKLYRKIVGDTTRTSEWQEVSEANGVNDLDTNGTSCWLSHNLGANSTSYENSIANVSGTFFDTPDTRFLVYYTVKWKSRLGDNNVNGNLYTSSGDLYLNRPANYNTSNSPVLSSSWVATEIWQLGTPFIPSEGVNIVTIYNQDYVGIGNTEPVYPLDINGETRITSNLYIDSSVGIGTRQPFCSLHVNATDCIKLPRGTTLERPQNLVEYDTGLIRYNTESKQFEGFGAGNAWGSLGGVIDIAQKTFVRAEKEAGLGNNELEFYTNNNERMIVKSDGKVGIAISEPGYMLDVDGDIRTASNLYVDNKIGIGTKNPSALLSLYGNKADLKIQDSRNTGDITTSIELINGNNSNFYNNTNCGWRMANSNNQYVVSSGINSVIADRLIVDGISGNIGIGQTMPNYKLDINGPINAQSFNINGSPFVLEFSQGMTIQTLHKTYTKTSSKSGTETDWVAIDLGEIVNDNSDGFVIKIKPSHIQSKVLVSLTCHIGMDYLQDSRWWGLRLYRKIGSGGTWEPVMGANGNNINSNGTSCWISHNMGADSSTYSHFITNVTGTYQDMPNTTNDVYYTAFWKSKLDGTSGKLYLNKAAIDDVNANYPLPSSSWTATEIWNNGTPYTPTTTAIAIAHEKVGIGTTPTQNSLYKLEVAGKINCESVNSYSDERYKKNIETIEPVLQLVNKIRSVSYNMKNQNDDIDKKSYGFIAQELDSLFPDVVNKPMTESDYYSINYMGIIPILTKSIQELSDKVEKQQLIINELINKL